MTSGSLHERITRALAFMLRHQPEDFDLELDRFGWGDLDDVLYAIQERLGSPVDEDDLLEAIEAGDRPRYEVEDEKIRALYGHSFPIDPGEPSEPPDELFIGVGSRDAERAEEHGLRSGRRAFLHLARTEEEAQEAGRRAAKDYAVVTVYAGEAYDEGIDFYDRGALFLADEIPTEFLDVGEVQHDGIDRERRPRGRRNADGPRGPRRRGRGRGRGRGGSDREERPSRDSDRDRYEPAQRVDRDSREREQPRERTETREREQPREREQTREREQPREREEARAPKPAAREQHEDRSSRSDGPSFGLGLVDQSDRKPKRAEAPRRSKAASDREDRKPEAPSRPAPEKKARRDEPSPPKEAPEPNQSSGGFGAGL